MSNDLKERLEAAAEDVRHLVGNDYARLMREAATELFVTHTHHMRAAYDRDVAQAQLDALTAENARLVEAEGLARGRADAALQQVQWFTEQAADVRLDGYRELGQRVAQAEAERDALTQHYRTFQLERDQARTELARCNDRLAALVAERDEARAQRDDLRSGWLGALDAAKALAAERDEAARAARDWQTEAQMAESHYKDTEAQLATALQQCANVEAQRDRVVERNAELYAKLEAVETLAEELGCYYENADDTGDLVRLVDRHLAKLRAALATPSAQESKGATASPAFEPFKAPPSQRCAHGKLPGEGCAYCLAFPARQERGAGGEAERGRMYDKLRCDASCELDPFKPCPEHDAEEQASPERGTGGLYRKYVISKADGSAVEPDADYFVLRLDTDPRARHAAHTYARDVESENPQLAADLRQRCARHWLGDPLDNATKGAE